MTDALAIVCVLQSLPPDPKTACMSNKPLVQPFTVSEVYETANVGCSWRVVT